MPIDQRDTLPRMWWLTFVCGVSALGGFMFGLDAIVISGAIGPVRQQFGLGSGAEGLFVAAALIGCAFGAAAAGPIADRFGRKRSLLLAALVTLIGVAACTFAASVTGLIVTRFIGGLGVGIASMTCPLYIAEIAPQHLRGRLVSLYQFAITLGILVALVCNALIEAGNAQPGLVTSLTALLDGTAWRLMFAVQIPAALGFLLLCLAIPESPRWLLWRGHRDAASAVLAGVASDAERNRMLEAFERDDSNPAGLGELFGPALRRPVTIAVLLAIFSELSGITVIFYYGPLLLEAVGAGRSGALSGFSILGLVNMAATLIALWLMDRAGRKPLLLVGSLGCAACMFAVALFLDQPNQGSVGVIAAICLFIAFFAFSLGPGKFVIASEIFPHHARGAGAALATTTVWLTGAVINQLFPVVRDSAGASAVFYVCMASLLLHFLFVWRFVPETAGRSLEEIELHWARAAPAAR